MVGWESAICNSMAINCVAFVQYDRGKGGGVRGRRDAVRRDPRQHVTDSPAWDRCWIALKTRMGGHSRSHRFNRWKDCAWRQRQEIWLKRSVNWVPFLNKVLCCVTLVRWRRIFAEAGPVQVGFPPLEISAHYVR